MISTFFDPVMVYESLEPQHKQEEEIGAEDGYDRDHDPGRKARGFVHITAD